MGKTRVVTVFLLRPARIFDRATGMRYRAMLLIPIGRPFPDIAGHIVKTVTVGREGADRRGPFMAVLQQILDRKISLPSVGHVLSIQRKGIAPHELRFLQAAPCGELPLSLRW